MKKWIGIGDRVQVDFEHVDRITGTLIDSYAQENCSTEYLIKDDKGIDHQVMHYSRMIRLQEAL